MSAHGPARVPCGSCPYRRDVPSGLWAAEEYDKLPRFDLDTMSQPFGAFFCHQQNERLCAGWVGCHDMNESLGLRMAASRGILTVEDVEAAFDYECPIALFASGAEAAEHGRRNIEVPSPDARRAIERIERKRERRSRPRRR